MNKEEIPKIKSKIEIGMHLWVINKPNYPNKYYEIIEIVVTGFYLNLCNHYRILTNREEYNGYYYMDIHDTIFFTKESAEKRVKYFKKIEELLNKRIIAENKRNEENKVKSKAWIEKHKSEYVGKRVMVKMDHDLYEEQTIDELQVSCSHSYKDIYFNDSHFNIRLLKRENKTWYFITKESRIAELKKEYDRKIAEIENEEKKNAS